MSTNQLIMTFIDYTDHFVVTFIHELPITLAVCLMSSIYYAQIYATQ